MAKKTTGAALKTKAPKEDPHADVRPRVANVIAKAENLGKASGFCVASLVGIANGSYELNAREAAKLEQALPAFEK